MNLRQTLRGTGVAIVTPFDLSNEIDFPALGKLIDFIIDNGVQYIVCLGTTGETPVLNSEEKKSIINFCAKHIGDRVPLVIGMGGNDTSALINDLKTYPLEGASAILSAAPYYNKPSQEGLFEHYRAVAAASPKPIILYNVPGRTGRNMNASTTLRLATEVSNIAGIKEASGDMTQCMEILKDRPEPFLVTSGDDALALPQIACGMDGVISVAANALPKTFSKMINHALAYEFDAAVLLNNKMIAAYDLMFAENNPAGVKAFLKELNIMENELRLPLVRLSGELHRRVKNYLASVA